MTLFFKICFKILKKPQVLGLKLNYSLLIYYLCFVDHLVVMRVVPRGLRE
jgi:hypothetical protein